MSIRRGKMKVFQFQGEGDEADDRDQTGGRGEVGLMEGRSEARSGQVAAEMKGQHYGIADNERKATRRRGGSKQQNRE